MYLHFTTRVFGHRAISPFLGGIYEFVQNFPSCIELLHDARVEIFPFPEMYTAFFVVYIKFVIRMGHTWHTKAASLNYV